MESSTITVSNISADLIVAGDNDRTYFDPTALAELASSIGLQGLAQPPTVRPLPDGRFEIVCGERRFRAMALLLGWTEIPVMIRDLNDEQADAIMLAENIARQELSPIDEGRAYRRRMDRFGVSIKDLSAQVGVSTTVIRRRVQLLDLRPEIQDLVNNRQFPIQLAPYASVLDFDRQMIAIAAYQKGLSYDQFRMLCERLLNEQNEQPLFDADSFFQVEEYVVEAKSVPRYLEPKARMRDMIRRLAAVVDQIDPELAAEARSLLAGPVVDVGQNLQSVA